MIILNDIIKTKTMIRGLQMRNNNSFNYENANFIGPVQNVNGNVTYNSYYSNTETKENVSQYMFIKSLGEHESIYRVQKIDKDLYKITKRITQ